jgi:frataxin-like iron-binding protein CyaY
MAQDNKRLQFLQDTLKKLAQAVREVSKGLIDLDKTISTLTGKVGKFSKEQQKAAKDLDTTSKNLKKTNDQIKAYEKNIKGADKNQAGFFTRLGKNIKTIISFYSGYLLLNGAIKLVSLFTVGAVKRFAELEAATARVGAVTNSTASELERLRKNTLDVAGATTFTAVEIAGLQVELGKLGFSAEEIQQSTLAIANAAQALGVGLADIAQKVGVTLRAFNLDASQAASVADTLTSAINGSALSFESFGTSIAYVAPIAGQLGITFQETAAAMGVLADSGFQASRIGTGLRKILLEVGESGQTLKQTLTELKGEQLSLNDVTEIFGKTAVAQATVLLNNIDKLDEYTGKFGELGAATKASAQQIDTLAGKFQLLNSAFDAFLVKLADNSTVYGTILKNFFGVVLPESVQEQLAAYKQIKDNDFFELLSESSALAAEETVKNTKSIYDEAERIVRQTLIQEGKISERDERILERGYAIADMSEEGRRAYNGLIEETVRLIRTKEDDLLATEGQERAVAKLTEAGKELVDTKREEVINQKQALEANKIANEEYANLQIQIDAAKDSLDNLTRGSDEYKRTVAEIGKLESLQQQVANFQFDEKDIEAIVTNLYKSIASLPTTGEARGYIEQFAKKLTKDISDTLKEYDDPANKLSLAPIFAPEENEVVRTFIQQLGDESAYSLMKLGEELAKNGSQMVSGIYKDVADERLDNLQRELDAELDVIEQRYEIEGDILKSQLDNQLITESQFRQKQIELRKAQLRDENDIEKQRFEAEKQQDLLNARADYLAALSQAFINEVLAGTQFPFNVTNALITSGSAAIAYAGQSAAINQRRFVAKKFEEGGMVDGPSHAQGGVPFTVQGRGGYEMEGGEFIVNKKAASMHRDLLERINNSYKVQPISGKYKFAQGGLVGMQADESVDYLKAIAEATTSTAIGVSKPVRAYVSDKDLRSNATERRIRDRNDRI